MVILVYKELVFYKGHNFLHNPQISTMVSFTTIYKGHTIHVGPERASRNLQSSVHKRHYDTNPGGTP